MLHILVNFQVYVHSSGFETLHQHIPKECLPNEYGGEAGKLDEMYGKYSEGWGRAGGGHYVTELTLCNFCFFYHTPTSAPVHIKC